MGQRDVAPPPGRPFRGEDDGIEGPQPLSTLPHPKGKGRRGADNRVLPGREVPAMTPAPPILRDEAFLEEHRRIQQRLARIQKFAGPASGFPTTLSALVACLDEMAGLLPDLSEHFAKEERLLRSLSTAEPPAENGHCIDQVMGEHQPLLRELRALVDSGRGVDLRGGSREADRRRVARGARLSCGLGQPGIEEQLLA